ncbi:hypothetical protein SeseC_00842 [Streptococcus equi subsp. zooepidemicus ATCC 35246]|nr:hypothetical protein SeseC_00842 [Streptococcus equi subsp. zooepidemicus ATCC 35246]
MVKILVLKEARTISACWLLSASCWLARSQRLNQAAGPLAVRALAQKTKTITIV